MSIEKKPSRFALKLILTPIRTFLESRSEIVVEKNDTLTMKPPYIILSNHVTNWDMFLLNCYVKDPICFVASDSLFRHPLLKRVLNYAGAIPKTKFKNDASTIRAIMKAKKNKRAIAIFPEGNRNWDGSTEPIIYTTAKLVKSLKIPVVVATISGGYLSHPRWADYHRKGKISISLTKVWDEEELANETPKSIDEKLALALGHDEVKWQHDKGYAYQGKALAEHIERLLFICPHCKEIGEMRSNQDLVDCQSCAYKVRYTPYGTFEQVEKPVTFATPRDWHQWQLSYMEKTIDSGNLSQSWQGAMKDHVKLYVSEERQPFQFVSSGTLSVVDDNMSFQADKGGNHSFELEHIEGLNVQLHHKLDFYYHNKMYRAIFYRPETSAYKWLKTIQLLGLSENKKVREKVE
ncbi:lysophospholipid acyltransferase family protein [Radiobacillus sp. PE A8.2]|uniref:lysophospholipid acyltransferase family protein n=1 Tax=Radiobacillus sp. PE A8.2 TaxID=3380349 RepID=UPI00388D36E4